MVVDELKDLKAHIKKQLSKGYEPDNVKKALMYAGFSRSLVNQAFAELKKPAKTVKKEPILKRIFKKKEKPKKVEKPVKVEKKKAEKKIAKPVPLPPKPEELPPPPKPKEAKKHRARKIGFTILIIVLLIAVGAALAFVYFLPISCVTEMCFIDKANICEQATYKNMVEGTTIYYETNKCVLTKTIVALDPEEPTEIVEAFLGKSMTCRYQMNNFSPMYLSTISAMVNTCEGPLRTAILAYSI